LYVFNRNTLLSVSDKHPQIYRSGDTGVQNLVPSPQGGFCGSSPPKASIPKLKCETLEISVVFINPYSVLSYNL